MTPPFRLRPAVSDDLASIVALHVASWRSAYRGIFSDRYLDGPIEAERQALWQARMRDPRPAQIVVVADDHAARGFYASVGGEVVERLVSIEADGSACADLRIAWPSPARLLGASRDDR